MFFLWGDVTKHFDWSYQQLSSVPIALSVPFGFASGNVEGFTETKLTVSLGASRNVLVDG